VWLARVIATSSARRPKTPFRNSYATDGYLFGVSLIFHRIIAGKKREHSSQKRNMLHEKPKEFSALPGPQITAFSLRHNYAALNKRDSQAAGTGNQRRWRMVERMDIKITRADRLMERRKQILTTLSYVDEQSREVEENTEWKDTAARRRRLRLLNELNHWYLAAIGRVEQALGRISDDTYGLCLDCSAPIEPEWLEVCPEAEVCVTCQESRDKVA
jgi:DnaK suppressor protein